MNTLKKGLTWFLFLHPLCITGFDNPHFYRATYAWPEPRYEQDWLTSWALSVGRGSTSTAYNAHTKKVPLFDLYGPINVPALGRNNSSLDPTNFLDNILLQLGAINTQSSFGTLSTSGTFHITEAMIHVYQNITKGIFFHVHLPIRDIAIRTISFTDLSPAQGTYTKDTPIWQQFLANKEAIFKRHDIIIKNTHETGVGDLTFLVGWTHTYTQTETWDFIDITGQWGVLAPSGLKKNIDQPFDIALGYDGFTGIPVLFDAAAGIFDWLTFEFHISALFLLNKTKTAPLFTCAEQTGIMSLQQTKACVDPGTVWSVGACIQADHIARGFSCTIGYTFAAQDRTILEGVALEDLSIRQINKSRYYGAWYMHTINVQGEYDFSYTRCDKLPKIGLWVNIPVSGKQAFDTLMAAPYIGLDLSWGW